MKTNLLTFMTLSLIFSACSSRAPRPGTFEAQGEKIGAVAVTINETSVDPERIDAFKTIGGASKLAVKIEETLRRGNMFDAASQTRMVVVVEEFRLRHAATRAFTGFWSGPDRIRAQVSVNRADQTLMNSEIDAAGGNGNPFNISGDSRADGLFNAFSSKTITELRRKELIQITANSTPVVPAPDHDMASSAPAPVNTNSTVSSPISDTSCAVEKILSMKKIGMSDEQIRAACKAG